MCVVGCLSGFSVCVCVERTHEELCGVSEPLVRRLSFEYYNNVRMFVFVSGICVA